MFMRLNDAKPLLPMAREIAGLASEAWSESYNLRDQRAEICIVDRQTGEVVPIALLTRDCSYDDRRLMMKAPLLIRALLTLLDAAFAEIRKLKPPEDPRGAEPRQEKSDEPNYAANCAMMCKEPAFRRFLFEEKELPAMDEDNVVAKHVRYLLKVDSRSHINTDANARKLWLKLRAEFESWMKEVV
ncbi:hypothetical protein [Rhizobium grahamii]|uniref:Uncharacterized protein n=1 Tax=Rhizobium grahamii CCGE 502 TaxID=990285 RepID=S3HL02_9HYPH|nr:hypothetical protein [Rhizobium grahamii]EPE99502.1 hypothetical protein RGCCGE502_04945 [Rhizobium grahamii CCGE 502]